MRHLHAGLPRGQQGPARTDARPDGARDPLLAGRQPLPVHRVRQDRERGDGCRRDAEKGIAMAETMTNGQSQTYVGTRAIRPDGVDKVTGRARFGADYDLAGQLIGRVLRSPHPHAKIIAIDTSKAEALPGVKAVITRDDFGDQTSEFIPAGEMMMNYKDVVRNVMAREIKTAPVHQGYIEPHAALASVSEDGSAELWCTTQGHFIVRAHCARLLGMDIGKIRVTATEIGGGFGGKTIVYLEPLALALSRKAKRPVKMVMSREEVFKASGPTSGATVP